MLRDPTSSLAPLPYLNVLPSMALLKSLIGAYVTDAAPKDLLPQLPNWIVHAQRDGLLGMMTVVLAGAACILFVESVRWYPSIRRRVTLGKAPLLSLGPSDSSALVSVQNLSKAYTKSKLAVSDHTRAFPHTLTVRACRSIRLASPFAPANASGIWARTAPARRQPCGA